MLVDIRMPIKSLCISFLIGVSSVINKLIHIQKGVPLAAPHFSHISVRDGTVTKTGKLHSM